MTKKHFEVIAKQIKLVVEASKVDNESQRIGVRATALAVADACAQTNDRFDRARFLAACGLD